MGDFELDVALIDQIPTHVYAKMQNVQNFSAITAYIIYGEERDYFTTVDLSGMSFGSESLYGGTPRYSYALPRAGETYTVIGRQENGRLVQDEVIDTHSLAVGDIGADGLIEKTRFFRWPNLLGAIALSFPFFVLGGAGILFDRPKEKPKTDRHSDAQKKES